MGATNARLLAVLMCSGTFTILAACAKPASDDMRWAQAALERNPNLKVLTVDRQARAFTVRLKNSGELRGIQADEIVGSVGPAADASTGAAAAPIARAETAVEPPAAEDTALSAEPRTASSTPTEAPATGPGVIASGPGYSIRTARAEGDRSGRSAGFAPNDSVGKGLPLERRDEPIICQGDRFVRLDSHNLEFSGDAIVAQDGCEIHITNSRIAAKGVGVSARAANVHVENSSIEGKSGSIVAEDAQVYTQNSHFRGVSRGLTSESLHDLGGNVWN